LDNYPDRTAYLCDAIDSLGLPHDAAILELGCACGRNLAELHRRGYRNLTGVDVSPGYVQALWQLHPELAAYSIIIAPAEQVVAGLNDNAMDAVFSLACLMHIPPENEWAFAEIARIARHVVCLEHETASNRLAFPRDYGAIFTALGFTELRSEFCNTDNAHMREYRLRIFRKERP